MQMNGNTILITGGGSGIGLGLAEALLRTGNQVVVAGRSKEKLAAAAKKGLETLTVDMTDAADIRTLARQALTRFPTLNVVIHSAGVMKNENLQKNGNAETMDATIATNLTGPMRLNEALLPHFLGLPTAVIMTVSSGLAFAPLAMTPTYCATKAAIHSYTQSLRYQLKDTQIQVIELVPPYVQTHLMGERQASDPSAMPLDAFVEEVMGILTNQPEVKEILVQRVMPQRNAAEGGKDAYESFFTQMNERLAAARKGEM